MTDDRKGNSQKEEDYPLSEENDYCIRSTFSNIIIIGINAVVTFGTIINIIGTIG